MIVKLQPIVIASLIFKKKQLNIVTYDMYAKSLKQPDK